MTISINAFKGELNIKSLNVFLFFFGGKRPKYKHFIPQFYTFIQDVHEY